MARVSFLLAPLLLALASLPAALASIHAYDSEYFYSVGDAYIFRGGREGLYASTKEVRERREKGGGVGGGREVGAELMTRLGAVAPACWFLVAQCRPPQCVRQVVACRVRGWAGCVPALPRLRGRSGGGKGCERAPLKTAPSSRTTRLAPCRRVAGGLVGGHRPRGVARVMVRPSRGRLRRDGMVCGRLDRRRVKTPLAPRARARPAVFPQPSTPPPPSSPRRPSKSGAPGARSRPASATASPRSSCPSWSSHAQPPSRSSLNPMRGSRAWCR